MSQIKIPRQMSSRTMSVEVAGVPGRLTVTYLGTRATGMFLSADGHGNTVSGMADAIGVAVTAGLHHGAAANDFGTALDVVGLNLHDLAA